MTPPAPAVKVQIPHTPAYWATALLLTYLCYQAHELLHHFVGAVVCGGFGQMTFGLFITQTPCAGSAGVTLAGPVLSFALAWWGAYALERSKSKLLAYTLIFASFAHLRFMLPLGKGGDEWLLARLYFSHPNPYGVAGVLFLLGLPPVVWAGRAIANPRRWPVLLASWVMPFPVLMGLSILDEQIFGSDPNTVSLSLAGIPVIVLLTALGAGVIFAWGGLQVLRQSDEV